MLSPTRPAHANGFSDFIAHTIHWGDFPTWLAAVGGLAAAVYAARAFKGVARQQMLNDRILRYTAYSQARAMVHGVHTSAYNIQPGNASTRRIQLANESEYRIDMISLTATLDALPCRTVDVREVNSPSLRGTVPWIRELPSGTGAIWEVLQSDATDGSNLIYVFRFRDEAGGRWSIDNEGRLALDDGARGR